MSVSAHFNQVIKKYGDTIVIDKLDLHIREKEFFTLLGPSGCGKTTLLRAISGFLDPSEGKVLIGGQDMAGIGPNKRPTSFIF